jgi:hypothetical protein
VKDSWDDCSGEVQAKIIAFDQIAAHDELAQQGLLPGAVKPSREDVEPKGRRAKSTPVRDAARAARAAKKDKKTQ